MKIQLKRILSAYGAIHEISKCIFPYQVTRKIHKLKKSLCDEFETILETENNMVQKYGGTVQNGSYHFDDAQSAQDFDTAYQEFIHQEVEINFSKVDVSKYTKSIYISSEAIDALEGLIDFGEE